MRVRRPLLNLVVWVCVLLPGCGEKSSRDGPSPAKPPAPVLMAPAAGSVLDNGCGDGANPVTWTFDWADVPGATRYHLYVIGGNATIPLVDDDRVSASAYLYDRAGGFIVDANRSGWRWRVRALVAEVWSEWSGEQGFGVEPLDSDCYIILQSPRRGATMDNGCSSRPDEIAWDFDWTDPPGAERYHLYVIGASATIPVVDDDRLRESSHAHRSSGYIADANGRGWRWRVRARVDGVWRDWTNEQVFDVEPVNTDCR